MVNEKNSKEHPGRHCQGCFQTTRSASTMALAYYQQDSTTLAKNMFPVCPVGLSSDNYYVFDKEDLLRDNWQRKLHTARLTLR
jgi:hypothetical protein